MMDRIISGKPVPVFSAAAKHAVAEKTTRPMKHFGHIGDVSKLAILVKESLKYRFQYKSNTARILETLTVLALVFSSEHQMPSSSLDCLETRAKRKKLIFQVIFFIALFGELKKKD